MDETTNISSFGRPLEPITEFPVLDNTIYDGFYVWEVTTIYQCKVLGFIKSLEDDDAYESYNLVYIPSWIVTDFHDDSQQLRLVPSFRVAKTLGEAHKLRLELVDEKVHYYNEEIRHELYSVR